MGTGLPSSGIGTRYLFSGMRFDPETEFYYDEGSRYVDPAAGRHTTRDGAGKREENNRYLTIKTASGPKTTSAKGDKVALVGFGSFSISNRSARTGRNPQTGATIQIKPSSEVSALERRLMIERERKGGF